MLEHFSNECRKTKVNNHSANHNYTGNPENQSKLKTKADEKRGKTSASELHSTISFGFTSDKMTMWRKFLKANLVA